MPTRNFGDFIGATLKSIIDQAPRDLEIVVLDGASTDRTAEIVSAWRKSFPALNYTRLDARGGIDRDMARSVDLATGDYCWLCSSDDIVKPGALDLLLEEMRSGHDLYLGGFTQCDIHMRPLSDYPLSRIRRPETFELSLPAERARYFEAARTTAAFFSFMGSIVIRRSKWNEVSLNEAYVGSLWAHVARIFSLIPKGLRLRVLARSLLDKRGDNDSFLERGITHRFGIAIDGYHRLADEYFGRNSTEAFHIRRVLRNEFDLRALCYFKSETWKCGVPGELARLDELVGKLYSDRTSAFDRARLWAYLRIPPGSYYNLRDAYRRLRKFTAGRALD
jgi:abequosyltransferase